MEGIQVFDQRVGSNGDVVYLKVNGFIDTSTSLYLVEKIKDLLKQGYVQLVVDMSGVNYVSSAGWGVFVGEIKDFRERGGDIKLVNMTPEVYDVFEMLEFNRILKSYDSVEEAVNEFDVLRGLDITRWVPKRAPEEEAETPVAVAEKAIPDVQISPKPSEKIDSVRKVEKITWTPKKVDPAQLPITEKIKHVIAENPILGIFGIKKELATPKYGNTRISILKLHKLLKELNLDTKEKRYRFYRSR
ncbi:MAG TPA: anti-sigma factor antagonist [Bacteroidetes bacterium]|nr:anti-sigma factor antagonist [Bacteroidota bacterium]